MYTKHMYHTLRKIHVEKFRVKNFHVKIFYGYGKPQKLNMKILEHQKLNTKIVVTCAYGHVHMQRIQDQPAVIDSFC